MEIIEKSLYENEKILWKNTTNEKEYALPTFLMVMIALIFSNIFFIFLYIVRLSLIFVVLIVVLNVIIIPIIMFQFIKELKEKKKGKNEKIEILTNKRWIQKEFRFINLDYGKYSKKGIEFHRDIAFINLNLIKFIEVHEWRAWGKSHYTYSISLYFSYNKKEPKGILLGTYFHFTPKYEKFIKNVKGVLQIKNEEYYEVNKSTKYYYFYF